MTISLRDARSAEQYERAVKYLPGGVNSPVRAMRSIGRTPVFIERGSGAEMVDIDGNHYIDWVCSWGPLIHGHAHPEIVAAITEQAARGTTFGAATVGEVDLAAELTRRIPSVEMLRMTTSGTEAAMSAIRLARAATGREYLLKFAGAYHGHVDGLLADAGSGLATQGLPSSPGVLPAAAAATIVVPWNDPDAVIAAAKKYDFAAILVEPYPGNMGVVPPQEGFLELLRQVATDNGALLVFDEVISGLRVARGGAQELTGVLPDITILGKIVGGGLPVGAFGGSRELMEHIAPVGPVYQAGTLAGSPLAVAAGMASVRMLDDSAYLRLGSMTDALASGLRDAIGSRPAVVQSVPGLVTLFFSEAPVTNYEEAKACDLDAYARFCRGLLARGVYAPPSQFEGWFPSLAHTPEQLERTLEVAGAALESAFTE